MHDLEDNSVSGDDMAVKQSEREQMASDGAEDEESAVETFEDEEMAYESVEDEMLVVETDDSDVYMDIQSNDDKGGTTHDETDDEENSSYPSDNEMDNEMDSEGLVQDELDDEGQYVDNLWRCHVCRVHCRDWQNLRRHLKKQHCLNAGRCQSCSKVTFGKAAHRRHLKTHRRIHCQETGCSRSFTRNSSLYTHIRRDHSHVNTRRPVRELRAKPVLDRQDEEERLNGLYERLYKRAPWTCHDCGKRLMKWADLKLHLKSQHRLFVGRCLACSRVTFGKEAHDAHQNSHRGVKCPVPSCRQKFASEASIYGHMRDIHGIIYTSGYVHPEASADNDGGSSDDE
ncbi:hypothetical protein BKA57DRAFT_438365 [Linnemannia elongata]|nr:hypothetical protein BKA57DRAFT_438365 [Linnemannia elongata]